MTALLGRKRDRGRIGAGDVSPADRIAGSIVLVDIRIAVGIVVRNAEEQILEGHPIDGSEHGVLHRARHVAMRAVHPFALITGLQRTLFPKEPLAGSFYVFAAVAKRNVLRRSRSSSITLDRSEREDRSIVVIVILPVGDL